MKVYLNTSVLFSFLFLFLFLSHFSFAQLQFIENKGQWDKAVDFKSDIQNGAFYLQRTGFTVLLHNDKDMQAFSEAMHGGMTTNVKTEAKGAKKKNTGPLTIHSHAYRVHFLGASGLVQMMPEKSLATYNNYFIGSDKSKWQGNCKIYQAVTYKDIYPNIDVRYYTDRGTLKYDLVVHPGGNIENIALKYEGADKLSVKNKELIIATSVGDVKELFPYSYQVLDKGRQTLACKYEVEKNIVRFKVKNYDPHATIVIDPTLVFCSFSGSVASNWGYTATPGPDGSFFAGGICIGDGYPTSPGAFQQTFQGGVDEDGNGAYDIGIIKLSADGSNRLYATYLGGSGNEQPHSMICDEMGNLIVSGRTNSPLENASGKKVYPVTAPFAGTAGGYDIVVTKFNADGTGILGSIRVGGSADDGVNIKPKYMPLGAPNQNDGAYDTRRNYGDDARSEVILDEANNIYLASCSQSENFPVTSSAFQKTFGGGGDIIKQDGVILKFNTDLSGILFSSFFGGTGNDACFVLSVNPLTGNLYMAGGTTSRNLPGDKTGAMYSIFQGGITDGFVTEISPDGSSIIKTTYIGTHDNSNDVSTDGNDLVYGIQFDKFGFPYIMGTTSGNWLALNATFQNAGGKQFIGKLKPDLSGYEYTTMFGTNSPVPNISPVAFLVDRCQNVYVSGWGAKYNSTRGYPCAGTGGMEFLITPDAIQSTTDKNDFFFFVLEKNATRELFGSFFGEKGGFDDHVDGGTSRFDANGIIYQAMCANCMPGPGIIFPATPGSWAPVNPSPGCNEAAVKIEMNFGGVGASVKATINGVVDTIGCVPLTVRFTDTLAKGKRYIWLFGDGSSPDTTLAPNNSVAHTYTSAGIFQLMLVSIDSLTCNIADTAYIKVRVGNNIVSPNFTAAKIGDCQSLTFQFNNTTAASLPVYKPDSFVWDFGDGTPLQQAGFANVSHTYASAGTYNVKLIVKDTVFCNAPDSVVKQVRLAVNVIARFETDDKGCQSHTAAFSNTSIGGTGFIWDFGDNTSSAEINPTHFYSNTGNYTVTLTAIDTTTCNRQDQTSFNITIYPMPIADFDFSPKPGDVNKPVNFSNHSADAVSYLWNFGDGEIAVLQHPDHLFNASGTFNVCLTASNAAGCSDTICKPVAARINPLLDVPNAFTPGKFGVNGLITVEGFGISRMDWKIYNRWGQLIFTSNNKKSGWDGTFKNVLQPMDVYTYTLDAEFSDGKKVRKTGDITLLR